MKQLQRLVSICLIATSLPALGLAGPADGPDIVIRNGTIVASAADYQMDGTMWTVCSVLEDSCVYLYRSTDHGLNWEYQRVLRPGAGPARELGLVVGEGDSAFVYIFFLDTDGNGDLWLLRCSIARPDSAWLFPVATGPDTIREFAVCRDYSGSNYWVYAALTNSDTTPNSRSMRFLRSSTYGREWVTTDSFADKASYPYLAAGAGSYIYFACCGPQPTGGAVVAAINSLWLSNGHWHISQWLGGGRVRDPAITVAFTTPDSLATVWLVYSRDYENSGDWNIMYLYTSRPFTWSNELYLAGSAAADEGYPDLRNYTSPGNEYVNASYISEVGQDRLVYRRYAHAANPTGWSDTLRINAGNAGTGSEVRPILCYTPGGPFTGAGCVFVGSGLNGLWWNAPYPAAVAHKPEPDAQTPNGGQTILRGVLNLQSAIYNLQSEIVLLDISGRKVLDLRSGANDVSRVEPGVYFVAVNGARNTVHVRKVIVTR